jgi:hypothetical protein
VSRKLLIGTGPAGLLTTSRLQGTDPSSTNDSAMMRSLSVVEHSGEHSLATLFVLAVEVLAKCIESLIEERREFTTPTRDVLQGRWLQLVQSEAPIAASRDEFCFFKNPQVLGDRGECYLKRFCKFIRRTLAFLEFYKNCAASRMCNRVEDVIFLGRAHVRSILGTLP